jgi:hypothetical protein
MILQKDLEKWFTYHPPKGDQAKRYEQIRTAALEFATLVVGLTPSSADQTVAVRHIRDAVMCANAAIACEE